MQRLPSSSFLPYVVLIFKEELRLVNINEEYINLKDSCGTLTVIQLLFTLFP